ncbi:matrixin family metalloprotease [Companilactobacillus mishanensis]|uniref:matrixin family metalloprotease n=1 Tax=Companilactobacillus mishanensis TaxID=2486008 RepID=UPI00129691B9|nr:matrixin family metalloprotease [Companilactobacillus mishanensis]MQS89850.1 matrixin family metalloprotease [Companilactobacillus mishanensis]
MKKFSLKKIIVSIAMMVTIFTAGAVGIFQNTNTANAAVGDCIWKNPGSIKVYVDPSLTIAEQNAIYEALSEWANDAPQFEFDRVYNASDAQIIYSSDPSADTMGVTNRSTTRVTGTKQWYISKATIKVRFTDASEYNATMQRTYTHETGHALGLADSHDKNDETKSVMYGTNTTASETYSGQPQKQDIQDLNSMYGF